MQQVDSLSAGTSTVTRMTFVGCFCFFCLAFVQKMIGFANIIGLFVAGSIHNP
jgi:hypothetical protein